MQTPIGSGHTKGQSERVGPAHIPFEAADGKEKKKKKKHNFELYRNIRGPVTGGQFHEQRQFHVVQANPGVLIPCLIYD